MTEPPDLKQFQDEFLHHVSARADQALLAGLDHATVAYILRMLSTEAAIKGGPDVLYKHSLLMQNEGEELRADFHQRFPDLDIDALMQGKIRHK
ncbi:hypothetical protein [Roseobacter sp. S98]|uniref:hypothetical protein n=1 Tax=Roseobacter algicola (ex Choi et al. 2025) (nom. illeg.) TaxID=3092138 RepID=UPI003F5124D4